MCEMIEKHTRMKKQIENKKTHAKRSKNTHMLSEGKIQKKHTQVKNE